jgi:galactose mutarotase-like enzyme
MPQVLQASGTEDPKYPHSFELRVTVTLAGPHTLTQELAVTNTGVLGVSPASKHA